MTADQTILTTIVSTDPLHFGFDGSEALLLRYERQDGGVRLGAPVRIRLQDEAQYVHAGRLDFIDNSRKPALERSTPAPSFPIPTISYVLE